jgi:hypothetical protein
LRKFRELSWQCQFTYFERRFRKPMYLRDGSFDDVLSEIERMLVGIERLENIEDIKHEIDKLIYAIHFSQNLTCSILDGILVDEGES